MDNLTPAFQALSDPEFPRHLHTAIMLRVVMRHYRVLFLRIGVVLILNVIISMWSVWTKAIELGTLDIMRVIVSDVRMSYLSFTEALQMAHDVIPVRSVLVVLLNTAFAIYVLVAFRSEHWNITKVDHSDAS